MGPEACKISFLFSSIFGLQGRSDPVWLPSKPTCY